MFVSKVLLRAATTTYITPMPNSPEIAKCWNVVTFKPLNFNAGMSDSVKTVHVLITIMLVGQAQSPHSEMEHTALHVSKDDMHFMV